MGIHASKVSMLGTVKEGEKTEHERKKEHKFLRVPKPHSIFDSLHSERDSRQIFFAHFYKDNHRPPLKDKSSHRQAFITSMTMGSV